MKKKSAYRLLCLVSCLLAGLVGVLDAANLVTPSESPCDACGNSMSRRQKRKCSRLQSSADVNGSYSMGVGNGAGLFNGLSKEMQALLSVQFPDLRDPFIQLPPLLESIRESMPGVNLVGADDNRVSQALSKDLLVDFRLSTGGYAMDVYQVSGTPQSAEKQWPQYNIGSYAEETGLHYPSVHSAYSTQGLNRVKRVEVHYTPETQGSSYGNPVVLIEEYDYFVSETNPGRKTVSWKGSRNGYPVYMEVSTPEKGTVIIDSISDRTNTGGKFDEFTQRHIRQERGADGQMYEVYNAFEKAITLDYGEIVILERTQTDGGTTHNTKWEYYLDRQNTSSFGRAKSMLRSDGYWETYEYLPAADGFVYTKKVSQWMGSAFGNEASSVVETSLVNDTWNLTYNETKTIQGNLVYRNTSDRQVNSSETVENQYEWTSETQYMLTKTSYYPETGTEAVRGKLKSITYPDGTSERYEYQRLGDGNLKTTHYSRDGIRTITTTLPNDSLLEEYSTHTTTGLELSYKKADVNSKDAFGRYTKYYHSRTNLQDFSIEERASCGLITYRRNRDGLETRIAYDYDNRLAKRESGYPGGIITVEETLRNGNTVIERKTAGSSVLEYKSEFDQMKQLLKETKPDINGDGQAEVTTHSYAMIGSGVTRETITYPDGATSIIERYGDNLLKGLSGTAELGTTYTYGTWSGGSWMRRTTGGSSETTWNQEYKDLAGQIVKSEQDLGNNTVAASNYVYNTKGQLIKVTNPDGIMTLYAYNTLGELSQKVTDMNWNSYADTSGTDLIVNYTYAYVNDSELGIARKVTQSTYGTNNNATATTILEAFSSVDGLKTRTVQMGQTVRTTKTLPVNGDYTYTEQDNVGCRTVYEYSKGILNRKSIYDSANNVIHWETYVFDNVGNLSKVTDARKGDSLYTYYATGLPKTEKNALGYTTSYAYDKRGRLVQITFPDNTIQYRNYTVLGQLNKIWGAQTYTEQYKYSQIGDLAQLLTYKDGDTAAAQVTNWKYDGAGRVVEKNYGGINPVRYEYSPGGLLKKRIWARGVVNTYAHDNAGRLLSKTYSDSTPAVSYTYNRLGQLTKAGNIDYSYDSYFRLSGDGSITNTYDSYGRLSGIRKGTEYAVDYTYDVANHLKTVSMDGKTFTYNYLTNAPYLIDNVVGPMHTVKNNYETNRDVLASKENKSVSGTVVSKYNYTVNNMGRRTSLAQTGTAFSGTVNFDYLYNQRGELEISNNRSTSYSRNRMYKYDGMGNRLWHTEGNAPADVLPTTTPGTAKQYQVNSLNQYSAVTMSSVVKNPAYDLDGNMTFDGTQTYQYDAENRLVKVIKSDGSEVRYVYDALSRRIKRERVQGGSITGTTDYVYDGWNMIKETTGEQSKYYLWGLDLSGGMQGAGGVAGLLAEVQANGANPVYRYFTYDGNGNVSEVLDATGSVIAHYEYDPFGNSTRSTGSHATANSWRFSTKSFDPDAELYYYGYRFYSSVLGRWINRDPLEEKGGINLYGFLENDGVNHVDLWGLKTITLNVGYTTGFSPEKFDAAKRTMEEIIDKCNTLLKGKCNPKDDNKVFEEMTLNWVSHELNPKEHGLKIDKEGVKLNDENTNRALYSMRNAISKPGQPSLIYVNAPLYSTVIINKQTYISPWAGYTKAGYYNAVVGSVSDRYTGPHEIGHNVKYSPAPGDRGRDSGDTQSETHHKDSDNLMHSSGGGDDFERNPDFNYCSSLYNAF